MLTVDHGVMKSGKSLLALVKAHQIEDAGRPVIMVSYEGDNRFGEKVVASRIGIQRKCLTYNNKTSFIHLFSENLDQSSMENPVLMIEECQFITPEQAIELQKIAVNYQVHCYGIRMKADGTPFLGMSWLLSMADKITQMEVSCECDANRKASMHLLYEKGERVTKVPDVKIGDGIFKPVCTKCFYFSSGV